MAHPKLKLTAAGQLGPTALAVDATRGPAAPCQSAARRLHARGRAGPGRGHGAPRHADPGARCGPGAPAGRRAPGLPACRRRSHLLIPPGEAGRAVGHRQCRRDRPRYGPPGGCAVRSQPAGDKEKAPAARFNTALSLPILETAIRKRLTVQLEYYEETKGSIVRQQVDPWRLERRRGQEYLVGFSHTTLSERPYLLAQIRSVNAHARPVRPGLALTQRHAATGTATGGTALVVRRYHAVASTHLCRLGLTRRRRPRLLPARRAPHTAPATPLDRGSHRPAARRSTSRPPMASPSTAGTTL